MNLTQENLAQINKIKSAGKQVMQIMVTECKNIYKTEMTEQSFVDTVYGGIKVENRTAEGVAFFKKVYFYLSTDKKDEEIERLENGAVTLALIDRAILTSAPNAFISGNDMGESFSIILKIIILIIILLLSTFTAN